MIFIAAQAETLIAMCKRLREQDREEEQFRRISAITDELERRLAELDAALAFLRQAEADGLAHSDELKLLATAALGKALIEARAAVANSEDYEHGPADEVLKPVDDLLRSVTSLARRVWTTHWGEKVPQSRENLLQALANLPGVQNRVLELRALEQRLQEISRADIPSPEEYGQFHALIGQLDELWAGLPVSADPDVENFLTKAATGGAAIADLTPSVCRWLEEQNLEGEFVIRPGSPA